MDPKKSQTYNFAYEVVPIMFHSQTTDFVTYLERDGIKFLEFWWNYIGEKLPEDKQCSMEGMAYEIIDVDDKTRVIMITLPGPQQEDGDVYYLGMIRKPERHFAWVRLPSTRVLAMVRRPTEEDPEATEVGDLTPRGNYVRMKKGPAANYEMMRKFVTKVAQTTRS